MSLGLGAYPKTKLLNKNSRRTLLPSCFKQYNDIIVKFPGRLSLYFIRRDELTFLSNVSNIVPMRYFPRLYETKNLW